MKQIIYQFNWVVKDKVYSSQKFKDIERDLQGWIDTGNVSLREYFNADISMSHIVLRFTSSMTTSEKQRILNCIQPSHLISVTTFIDDNRIEIGKEVDYSANMTTDVKVGSDANSFKQAVYDLFNKQKAAGVIP